MTVTKTVRKVKIDRLKPTQCNLTDKTLLYLSGQNPNLENIELPQIHEINGEMYISDGHNKLFYQAAILGRKKVFCECLTGEDNCQVYSEIGYELEKKAREAEMYGVYKVSDLI